MNQKIKKNTYSETTSNMMKLAFAIILGQYYHSPKLYDGKRTLLNSDERPAYKRVQELFPKMHLNGIRIQDPVGLDEEGRIPTDGYMKRTLIATLWNYTHNATMTLNVKQCDIGAATCQLRFTGGKIIIRANHEVSDIIEIRHTPFDLLESINEPSCNSHFNNGITQLIDMAHNGATFLFITKD